MSGELLFIDFNFISVIAVPGCLCLDIKHKREFNYDAHSLYYLDEYRAHEPRYLLSGNMISEFNKMFTESSSRPVPTKNFADTLGPHVGQNVMK